MTVTTTTEVTNQIQTMWSSLFMQRLDQTFLLPNLVNKEYEGEIKEGGTNKVRVSQINAATGENRTVGVDADQFGTEALSTTYVDVTANKRAVASFEFSDLAWLQSQIGQKDSEVREALMQGVGAQINNYLYSLVSPSTSSPDHVINGVTDFNAAQFSGNRVLAGSAKWKKDGRWYQLLSPSYYGDAMDDTTIASMDYRDDAPFLNGELSKQVMGFWTMEDNTDGLINNLGTSGTDCGLAFHPDFLLFVRQTEPRFKISDLHSNKQFGFVISVDIIYGAALGPNGNVKHIRTYNT